MRAGDIQPGSSPSYELCKTLYAFHPLGAKLAEKPIEMAQSQERKLTLDAPGGKDAIEAFKLQWELLGVDDLIYQTAAMARVYGVTSIAALVDDQDAAKPLDPTTLVDKDGNPVSLTFNVFDPLNTSGSLVINQQPNAKDFLKPRGGVNVQGQYYHPTRVVTKMNEKPIYIEYTTSAFGYVGRSVYQRTLYQLKSFLNTMIADDMVARKAGIIVTKMVPAGSIIDRFQQIAAGLKRSVVKEAETDNIITIGTDEEVSAIDLQNVNGALSASRQNILNNIASGASMPAILVNEETFSSGLSEGGEDARHVSQYIGKIRKELEPLYRFFTQICQYRAWTPQFMATVEDLKDKTPEQVFVEWQRSFKATWPQLIEEPDQKEFEQEQLRLEAVTALLQMIMPFLDPYNRALMIEWVQDNLNAFESLFAEALALDIDDLANYDPEGDALAAQEKQAEEAPARKDSVDFRQKLVKRADAIRLRRVK